LGIVSRLPADVGSMNHSQSFPGSDPNVIFLKNICLTAVVLIGLTACLHAAEPAQSATATAVTAAHEGSAAAKAATEEHHGLPSASLPLFNMGPLPVTNSMLVTWIVALGLILFARMAMRNLQAVPSGAQNFWE